MAVLSARNAAGQSVPPDASWSSLDTEHFTVTFSDGLEPLARRAGERAERAYSILSSEFLPPPEGRIELVVTDHVDFSNGMASPFPRNRIVAYAQPPISEPSLALHDDWLGQLIIHELVHTFHLDYAEGVWPHLRPLFGRNPYLFPAIFSPGWIVEGLATYYESALTRGGRVRGSTYDMMLRAAILEDQFFGIDVVSLDPVTWPGGTSRYTYGALFFDHLASRFGPEAIPALLREAGGEIIPYRLDAAAQRTLGTSLTEAWEVWEDSLRLRYSALADSIAATGATEPELLTGDGRVASHPRFSPDGSSLIYAASTGREETDLRLLNLSAGSTRSITPRSSTGAAEWMPDGGLLYSQIDFDGRVRMLSDLYRISSGGSKARITRKARIWEAHPHPDGDRAIAVRAERGTNVLSVVDLEDGEITDLTTPDLDIYWASPRWSPDGSRIVVSRWRAGFYDLVLLDAEGRVVREITRDRAIDSAPSWSEDGRYILFSSDRTGTANIYAFDFADGSFWQVTNVVTGAFQPDVSSDGGWIAFSFYRADGYHIARVPFEPARWRRVDPAPSGSLETGIAGLTTPVVGTVRPYSAWRTLRPSSWTPLLVDQTGLGTGIGIGLGGEDLVERHAWNAAILWHPASETVRGVGTYSYRGLNNPVLDLRIAEDWEQTRARPVEGAAPEPILTRERAVEGRTSWLWRSWRSATSLEAGADLVDVQHQWRDDGLAAQASLNDPPLDLGAFLGAAFSSRRGYALSLGVQDGFLLGGRYESRRYLASPDWLNASGYWRATARTQLFRPHHWFGFAPSVAAARVTMAIQSNGASTPLRLGGASGVDPLGSSSSGSYPVRGYGYDVQHGDRIVSGSVEYRFPLLLVERGFRLLPLALSRFWGDLFLDGGAAWCAGECPGYLASAPASPEPILSIGAEAHLDLRVGYLSTLPLRGGIALPLPDGPRNPYFYIRLGPSF